MRSLTFIIIITLVVNPCRGQKQATPCKNLFEPDIVNTPPGIEQSMIGDTLQKKIDLIFELKFDDSVIVFIGNKIVEKKKIKTDKFLGVSKEGFSVDYSTYPTPPVITILLNKGNTCVSFFPLIGKRIAYINHVGKGWSIELSNTVREYR